MQCSVFVPSHITGFFEIKKHSEPLLSGSRGAGVTLDQGVHTRVVVEEGGGKLKIVVNGQIQSNQKFISKIVRDLLGQRSSELNLDHFNIRVEHEHEVPAGSGFGVSAACALGASLGLSNCLKLPLTFNQACEVAHLAELELASGLGDVMGEAHGGIVLRLKEGAPGWGMADRILLDEELYVISRTLGEIDTADIINNPQHQARINQAGSELLGLLLNNPTPTQFMHLSRRFIHEAQLMDEELEEILKIMDEESLGASMAMLGQTAFAISSEPYSSVEKTLVSRIDNWGCRFL
ncbi:MAG TPA: pantoate kinase [Methanobacteriaceae archaeon]|nr:pantoate kinase [Euryarchaeota archaeon]HNR25539.1 pantoate kinase [Methanobacteriaceae archaeon]